MAEKLAHTCAKHGGNRSAMTKLSNEANDLQVDPINKRRLEFITASPNEKLNLVKTSRRRNDRELCCGRNR